MSGEPEVKPNDADNNKDESEELKNVHSANSWEKADLGDTDRKNKFLRLMGAGKKEHHGRFVIGDQKGVPARKVEDTETVSKELENQYNQGMEHRLTGGRKGHIGLGFHEEEEPKEPDSSEGAEAKSELKTDQSEIRGGGIDDIESVTGDSDDKNKSESKTESSNKHKLPDDSKNEVESPTAIKKMKFVKSSS